MTDEELRDMALMAGRIAQLEADKRVLERRLGLRPKTKIPDFRDRHPVLTRLRNNAVDALRRLPKL